MNEILSVFLLCIGGILIGVATTVKLFCWLSVHNYGDRGEGCLSNVIAIPAITLALYLFYLAL